MFHVGQKVVCVDGSHSSRGSGSEAFPVAGEVYTIRDLVTHPNEVPGVRLLEIRNAPQNYCEGRMECTFHPRRFRPAVKKKTDISIFTNMLNTKPLTQKVGG